MREPRLRVLCCMPSKASETTGRSLASRWGLVVLASVVWSFFFVPVLARDSPIVPRAALASVLMAHFPNPFNDALICPGVIGVGAAEPAAELDTVELGVLVATLAGRSTLGGAWVASCLVSGLGEGSLMCRFTGLTEFFPVRSCGACARAEPNSGMLAARARVRPRRPRDLPTRVSPPPVDQARADERGRINLLAKLANRFLAEDLRAMGRAIDRPGPAALASGSVMKHEKTAAPSVIERAKLYMSSPKERCQGARWHQGNASAVPAAAVPGKLLTPLSCWGRLKI